MLGIAPGARLNDNKSLDHDLNLLEATLAHAIRWYPNQAGVEPKMGSGDYDWSEPDAVIAGAGLRGMQVLIGVSSRGDGHQFDTAHIDAIGPYAAALADRYPQSAVTSDDEPVTLGFEGINEGFFTKVDAQPTAARYLACQAAIYEGVKSIDPTVLVGTGGIIGSSQHLVDLYAAAPKTGRPWDFLAWHPYSRPRSAQQSKKDKQGGWWAMLEARAEMVANGEAHKQIWITEDGWNTAGPEAVTELEQAEFIADAVQRFRRHAWAGPMFLFTGWDSRTPNLHDKGDFMGLYRADDSGKPALSTFRELAKVA